MKTLDCMHYIFFKDMQEWSRPLRCIKCERAQVLERARQRLERNDPGRAERIAMKRQIAEENKAKMAAHKASYPNRGRGRPRKLPLFEQGGELSAIL